MIYYSNYFLVCLWANCIEFDSWYEESFLGGAVTREAGSTGNVVVGKTESQTIQPDACVCYGFCCSVYSLSQIWCCNQRHQFLPKLGPVHWNPPSPSSPPLPSFLLPLTFPLPNSSTSAASSDY